MRTKVVVLDYGLCNLFSVVRALEVAAECEVVLDDNGSQLSSAQRIILPGVGAFADGMQGMRDRGLVTPLLQAVRSGTPLLGICLGMQLLADESEEFGLHRGLGLISGRVLAIPHESPTKQSLKVPFVGWSSLNVMASSQCLVPAMSDHEQEFYLVHSFQFRPDDPSDLVATYDYGGHSIAAVVRRGAVMGVQFHPEKSAQAGLGLLRRFVQTGDIVEEVTNA